MFGQTPNLDFEITGRSAVTGEWLRDEVSKETPNSLGRILECGVRFDQVLEGREDGKKVI